MSLCTYLATYPVLDPVLSTGLDPNPDLEQLRFRLGAVRFRILSASFRKNSSCGSDSFVSSEKDQDFKSTRAQLQIRIRLFKAWIQIQLLSVILTNKNYQK